MSDVFCRKIYVDSAQRISGTPSNFKVSLVRDVALPKRCAAFVSDVSIPHTWQSVDEFCNRLYWEEYSWGGVSQVEYSIPPTQQLHGRYTGSKHGGKNERFNRPLALHVQNSLRKGSGTDSSQPVSKCEVGPALAAKWGDPTPGRH